MVNKKTVDGVVYIAYGGISGRKVYAKAGATSKLLNTLEEQKMISFHHRYIYNCIKTLKNPSSGYTSKERTSMTGRRKRCSLSMAGSELEYYKLDGCSFITRLTFGDGAYDEARLDAIMAGLYKADRDDRGSLEIKHPIDQIDTLHAAVSGEVMAAEECMQFLPKMIELGYPSGRADIRGEGRMRGFALFFTPPKSAKEGSGWQAMARTMPITTKEQDQAVRQSIVDRLSASIELAGQAGGPAMNWTIQGSGSTLYCEALEQACKRSPNLSLFNHKVHFVNPHTSPTEIQRVIDLSTMAEGDDGLYKSNMLSKGSFGAMASGNKAYNKKKIAESKANNPEKSTAANEFEGRRVGAAVHGARKMVVKISTLAASVTGALAISADTRKAMSDLGASLLDTAVAHPIATGASLAVTAFAWQETMFHTTPKMKALAIITAASLLKDRRLDQTTEVNKEKAVGQLKNLRLGMSI